MYSKPFLLDELIGGGNTQILVIALSEKFR